MTCRSSFRPLPEPLSGCPAAPSYRPLDPELLEQIEQSLGSDAVIDSPERMEPYAQDASQVRALPELVVEPRTVAQVQQLLSLAHRYRFPVTARGLGTGLAGGAVPLCGGVVLSLAKMSRIIDIDHRNLLAVVEPGVVNLDLKKAARLHGLFYPPDPASADTCSIGGNAATNAAGPGCIKYGTTRDYVLGLEAVLADGKRLTTGVATRKGVVGYDLTHLLVGSEGTLAVITKLFLKLIPHPPTVTTMVATYGSLKRAMASVTRILNAGHTPCAIEFLDRHCLDLVGDLLPLTNLEGVDAFLLIEVDGAPDLISQEIETIGSLCLDAGAANVLLAGDAHKRAAMWEVRRRVSLRIEQTAPLYIAEDIVVPIAAIASFVDELPAFEERFDMTIYCFGHCGDGNIHLNLTASDPERRPAVERAIVEIIKRVIEVGGTLSGEHGIGSLKRSFLPMELSAESIRLQTGIKHLFDPRLILNPGKLFYPPLDTPAHPLAKPGTKP